MKPRRLQDRDSAEQAQLIRTAFWLYPTALIMLGVLAFWLREQGLISALTFKVALVVNIPLAGGAVLGVNHLVSRAAQGLTQVLTGAGNLKPDPSFSLEDALIARGQTETARATLEARITGGHEDTAVRLRLADLHARILRNLPAAERWYQEARSGVCDGRQQAAILNGLIDLYRASGQRGRLMTALSRFAATYPATRAGRAARDELLDMKQAQRG
ncbi:MAG: hypothetical protein SGI84_13870 [Gemmatimonadota bacterium]|nr:hypothetical protein [Gemmatimonadota bacterium]